MDEAGQGDPEVVFSETHRANPLNENMSPNVIVLFGATGDLARRKLLPGLLNLCQAGLMPPFRVVGAARTEMTTTTSARSRLQACDEFGRRSFGAEQCEDFAQRLSYVNIADPDAALLAGAVDAAARKLGPEARLLHYLSVPPAAALGLIGLLGEAGLVEGSRMIMEKPFGTDLESARELNDAVHEVFAEEQVFRIDHFLGKEAAQNILALRFANGLFEPIWNRYHIDHVQIDVPETLEVGIARRLLREDRRLPRHGRHPSDADPRLRRDGAADRARAAGDHRGEEQGLPLDPPDRSGQGGPRPVRGLPLRARAWRPTPRPRRSSRCAARSTTGAGRACRSTCAPASGWPRAPGSSRSPSGSRRRACSRPHSGVGEYGPDHLTFDLDDYARLSLSFYGKRPGAER